MLRIAQANSIRGTGIIGRRAASAESAITAVHNNNKNNTNKSGGVVGLNTNTWRRGSLVYSNSNNGPRPVQRAAPHAGSGSTTDSRGGDHPGGVALPRLGFLDPTVTGFLSPEAAMEMMMLGSPRPEARKNWN